MDINDSNVCNRDKVKILLVTHGRFGEELMNSAKMIIGEVDNIKAISLLPTHGHEEFKKIVEDQLKELGSNVLVLTDILGGTPSNIVAILSRENSIAALSGVNLNMLIEAAINAENYDCKQLCKTVKDTGKDSIQDIIEWVHSRIS